MIKKDKKLDENLECFCKIEDNKAQEKFDPETLEKLTNSNPGGERQIFKINKTLEKFLELLNVK